MLKDINLKFLIGEVIRNSTKLIVISIIIGLAFGVVDWINTNKQIKNLEYCASAKISLKNTVKYDHNEYSELMADLSDRYHSEENISILVCDEVLDKVVKDQQISDIGLTIPEIRGMLYPRDKENGTIIELNVVSNSIDMSIDVCDKVLLYGSEYFNANGYNVRIVQDTTAIGPVSLSTEISKYDPRDIYTIVNQCEYPNLYMSALKSTVIGIVIGIFICVLYMSVLIIIRGRIVYPEQIKEITDFELLGVGDDYNTCKDIFSNILFNNIDVTTIHLMSLEPIEKNKNIVSNFKRVLETYRNEVGVIAICDDKNTDNTIIDGKEVKRISNNYLTKKEEVESILRSLKEEYECILFVSDGLSRIPFAKNICSYIDETFIVIENNVIKADSLKTLEMDLKKTNINVAGVVFI